MAEVENKKEYEMSYFLTADVSEEKVTKANNELNLLLTESGGENIRFNLPQKKRLAYQIKKQNEAYFGVVDFNVDKEGLDKIKKALALSKNFLRFLILNKALKSELVIEPQPIRLPDGEAKTQPLQKTPEEAPTISFDEKLESILKG